MWSCDAGDGDAGDGDAGDGVSMLTGAGPVDRERDLLGDDPAGAFSVSLAELRDQFGLEGALRRVVVTPFGQRPASVLAEMRVNEMLTHGWDVARATGQSTDLDPELAESCIEGFRAMRSTGRGAGLFGDEQPAPPGATAADRLAAVTGRAV